MTAVSLNEAKLHLRVDGTDEDTLISLYIEAAESWVAKYLDLAEGGLPGEYYSPPEAVPAAIKAAILLVIGDMYDNRSGAVAGTTAESKVNENPAVNRLLFPWKRVLL